MDENELVLLEKGPLEEIDKLLAAFISKNCQSFTFSDLNANGKKRKLWNILFNHLNNPADSSLHKKCLNLIRILSREKEDLDDLISEQWMDILLKHAKLMTHSEILNSAKNEDTDYEVALEALKCLCNIIFNSRTAQTISAKNHSVEGIVIRLRTYGDPKLPNEIKFFDMKMLFLITALCAQVRPKLKEELHGLTYLMEILDLILKEASENVKGATSIDAQITLNDDQTSLACEVLKVLFNLNVKCAEMPSADEEEETHFIRVVSILRELLLSKSKKLTDLHQNVINLLTSVPANCLEELTPLITTFNEKFYDYEGYNIEALSIIINYLAERLSEEIHGSDNAKMETLCPPLVVLLSCSRGNRIQRKYIRSRVLPPLKDAHIRPEEGQDLRGYLTRLLTSPSNQARDITADLLFVLCKENVMRLVKYTGYGNAAGLLAKRGLLMGGPPSSSNNTQYSSESEESETEEYAQLKHQINLVSGCVEPPRIDPMALMTDEQKEYEAVQLVNMMDKLHRHGIVQPCRVGDDGRPEPVQHILQLVEDLPRQQVKSSNSHEED